MDILNALVHHLLEHLQGRVDLQNDWGNNGVYHIWWTHIVDNPKLKVRFLQYQIVVREDYAELHCLDLSVYRYYFSDPDFPNNLLKALPVLKLT